MGEFLHTSKLWGWGHLYTLPDFGEGERDLLWMTVSESFCKILVVVGCYKDPQKYLFKKSRKTGVVTLL